MAYISDLGAGQQLRVENRGEQTWLALSQSSSKQQSGQCSRFRTGKWEVPPMLFRRGTMYVLRVESVLGQQFFRVQGNGFGNLQTPPSLVDAEKMPLYPTADGIESNRVPEAVKVCELGESYRCPQCGARLEMSDRFCHACGGRLVEQELKQQRRSLGLKSHLKRKEESCPSSIVR